MSENRKWQIKINQTISITRTLSSASYPDMTVEEALAFERDLDRSEKINSFTEELPYVKDEDLQYSDNIEAITPEG